MGFIVDKIQPTKGFAHAFHLSFLAVLPPVLLVLVRLEFYLLALAVLLLSKWRMLALHPRHWIAHVRTNAVDIIVGLSVLVFLIASSMLWLQILWIILFEIWLLNIKRRTSVKAVALQAVIAHGAGLSAIFLAFEDASLGLLVAGFWLVAYFSARHFFNVFEETDGRLLSSVWAFFAGALAWVLVHWLIFIGPIGQPAVIASTLAYGLAGLYYLKKVNKLSSFVRRQIVMAMFAILFVIIIFSDWGDKSL